MNATISKDEFLYRGVIELNWDYHNNRPTSAVFKDTKGVSVDRDNFRQEIDCVDFLLSKKHLQNSNKKNIRIRCNCKILAN